MNDFFVKFFSGNTVDDIYNTLTYNLFDRHIKKSVPKYKKIQKQKIKYIIKSKDKNLLDVGGTTGSFCKTISLTSNIKTINLDINNSNIKTYNEAIPVKNYKYISNDFIKYKGKKFDFINCSMTLPFISSKRKEHIKLIKLKLNKNGEVFIEEKVKTNFFYFNELLNWLNKLIRINPKQNYFKISLIKKLNKNIITEVEFVKLLKSNFKYVDKYYSFFNYIGYYATNDINKFKKFKAHLLGLSNET